MLPTSLCRATLTAHYGETGATLLLALDAEYRRGKFTQDTWIAMSASSWLRGARKQQRGQQGRVVTAGNLRAELTKLYRMGVLQRRFHQKLFKFRLNWRALDTCAEPAAPTDHRPTHREDAA